MNKPAVAAGRAAPALLWAAVIWWSSAQPGGLVALYPGVDKLVHGAVYAVLGLLLTLACPAATPAGALRAMAIGTAYGVSDEIHQYFVPGRAAEVGDVIADWCGVALAAGLAFRRHGGRQ